LQKHLILCEDYTIINSKNNISKTMTEKSSLRMAIQGENAGDWEHFYGTGKRSSPPELASGPLLQRKDASAQAVILMKRTSDTYRIAC
jgi:hypothetical protein